MYGVDTFEGRVGFWSDFVKGRTLSSLLAIQGPFGPHEAALIGIDLCKALSAVHAAGLLHRDIKASNAMREEGGRILLMDFGLSLEGRDAHRMGGTPTYMAPELFKDAPATVASDIYALGILLYYLLTGKYPVDAPTLPEFTSLHETNRVQSLYDKRTDLPDKLVQVVETAIRKNPAERYQSAGQMLSALSDTLSSNSGSVAPESVAPPAETRSLWWMAVPAAALLVAVIWFTPLRERIPFLRAAASVSGPGVHETYLKAQDYLDKYYLPHNLDNAIAGFQRTVAADPQFALGYGGLCRALYLNYHDLGTPELLSSTQSACAKANGLNSHLASVHVTLGMLYTLTNKYDLAAQELDTALGLDSRNAEAYGALAELYSKQGRTKDVAATFQKAEDLAPGDWRWSNQLGYYYLDNGRFEEAAKQYQAAVKLSPDNSRAWNNLGIAYRRQGRFAEAKAAYKKAIELESADNYFANLGLVLEEEGSYQEAVDMYLKASTLNPSNYLTWGNLASVYDRIPGNHEKALESYLKAIRLAEAERKKRPDDATLLARLGSYYATIGVAEKSLPLLRQAAALEPENPQVLYRVAEGYELLHHRDEALQWIEKALDKKYSLEALKRNPEMAALIADRRFAAIAAGVAKSQ